MNEFVRLEIGVTPKQDHALRQIAKAQGNSIASVARQLLQEALDTRQREAMRSGTGGSG